MPAMGRYLSWALITVVAGTVIAYVIRGVLIMVDKINEREERERAEREKAFEELVRRYYGDRGA